MLNISDEACAITKRFFSAIDVLVAQRKLRSLNKFAQTYNINYWNLCTLRKEPERRALKVEYVMYLYRDYNVSAEYLLLGVGQIFAEEHKEKQYIPQKTYKK